MSSELPKVLVVTINAWRDNTGINNLMELFKAWDKDRLAQVYTRAALPNTKICSNIFQISESAVMRSIFFRKTKTGKVIKTDNGFGTDDIKDSEEEEKLYKKKSKIKRTWVMKYAQEIVWKLGKWKTAELNSFVDSFNPDVLYLTIYSSIYMCVIQYYIMKRTKKPAICSFGDDNYTFKTCGLNPMSYLRRIFLRKAIRNIVNRCDKMIVVTPKMKDEYDEIFGVDSIILSKGIDYTNVLYDDKLVNKPLKMVYTGKLYVGRWKSLASIANALGEINKDSTKITLDIYSPENIEPSILKKLNRNGCVFRGGVTMEEVFVIQANADIVVFVESLDRRYKNSARLSFSTKITDYFKSGKCIFAIGSKDTAPIDYLIKNDCAVVATNYHEVEEKIQTLVNSPATVKEYGRKAFEYGKKNHNVIDINNRLRDTIIEVSKIKKTR